MQKAEKLVSRDHNFSMDKRLKESPVLEGQRGHLTDLVPVGSMMQHFCGSMMEYVVPLVP